MDQFQKIGGVRKRAYGCHLSERFPGNVFIHVTGGSNTLTPAETREFAYELVGMAAEGERITNDRLHSTETEAS